MEAEGAGEIFGRFWPAVVCAVGFAIFILAGTGTPARRISDLARKLTLKEAGEPGRGQTAAIWHWRGCNMG